MSHPRAIALPEHIRAFSYAGRSVDAPGPARPNRWRTLIASVDSPDNTPSLADLRSRRSGRSGAHGPSATRVVSPSRTPAAAPPPAAPSLFDLLDSGPAADPADAAAAPADAISMAENASAARTPPAVSPPQPGPEARVWSVGDLVRQVRGLVERSYAQVSVAGEISNWRPAGSGHCYFTIKDREAQLSAVMFRRQALLLRFKPQDGDAVRLRGQLSVYENRGQMQMIVDAMEQQGLGALLAAVRELKERLRREGLFERKRPLPAFPRCIGVVTSVRGAALRDIVKVCRRRHGAVNLLIYPAAVQGPRCAAEVAAGVRWFSAHSQRADVVIVARGGGSWEDLHGFDDEGLARAIAACAIPVIAGIGHAVDSTIADAAADVCAPTPSAAAELVTAAQHRIEEQVERLQARLERAGRFQMLRGVQRLSRLSAEVVLARVRDGLGQRVQRIDQLEFRAEAAILRSLRARGDRLMRTDARVRRQHAALRLAGVARRLQSLRSRLEMAQTRSQGNGHARLERANARLQALNPLRVLERGYALVYGPEGRLLRSASEVDQGQTVVARLASGRIQARVTGRE